MQQTDLYYQVALEKYQSQEWLNREFATKAGTMLGFGGAIVGAGAVILSIPTTTNQLSFWIFAALIVAFVFMVLASMPVLRPRDDWQHGPKMHQLADALDDDYNDGAITRSVGEAYCESVEHNRGILDCKGKCLQYVTKLLTLEALILGLLAGVSYWAR